MLFLSSGCVSIVDVKRVCQCCWCQEGVSVLLVSRGYVSVVLECVSIVLSRGYVSIVLSKEMCQYC